jgi:hypothetical protein
MIMMLYGRRWPSLQLTSQAGFWHPTGPAVYARPADRINVHVAAITHNPASSPGSDAGVPAPAGAQPPLPADRRKRSRSSASKLAKVWPVGLEFGL